MPITKNTTKGHNSFIFFLFAEINPKTKTGDLHFSSSSMPYMGILAKIFRE